MPRPAASKPSNTNAQCPRVGTGVVPSSNIACGSRMAPLALSLSPAPLSGTDQLTASPVTVPSGNQLAGAPVLAGPCL